MVVIPELLIKPYADFNMNCVYILNTISSINIASQSVTPSVT